MCSKDGLELGLVVNRRGDRLQTKRTSGGFERAQIVLDIRCSGRVEEEGDPSDIRGNLLEKLKPSSSVP